MKLEVKHLVCGYNRKKALMDPLSFVLEDHEVCCILGPNGVGKTTLFKTILRLIPPLEGEIYHTLGEGDGSSRPKEYLGRE